MKGIYLASYKALHNNYDIDYQDINGKRDIAGDMLDIDLTNYDYIIATPPCNYYSRANYRRETSIYSQKTKHLLPQILKKLKGSGVPYIVENVRNYPLMKDFYYQDYVFVYGRHTYWTNVKINEEELKKVKQQKENVTMINKEKRQGSDDVAGVIELFLKTIHSKEKEI